MVDQTLAATLLRLLPLKQAVFRETPDLRRRAWHLIDRVLGPDVYLSMHLKPKDATFRKEEILTGVWDKRLTEVRETLIELDQLASVARVREEFLKRLNGGFARPLLRPFLPASLRQCFSPLFGRATDMLTAEGVALVAAHERAKDACARCRDEARRVGGAAADALGREAADRLSPLIASYFSGSAEAQPADIQVEPVQKRYPLSRAGVDLSLRFRVINAGPGSAIDLTLEFETTAGLGLARSNVSYGVVPPSVTERALQAVLESSSDELQLAGVATWRDTDGQPRQTEFSLSFPAQQTTIDWVEVAARPIPYSLEPVESEAELVGRDDLVEQAYDGLRDAPMLSFVMHGQKRVGKTSIANAIASRLKRVSDDYVILYLLMGDYRSVEAARTITDLGHLLVTEARAHRPELADIPVPEFDGSLAPLRSFFAEARAVRPGLRFVVILDEFDELPVSLLRTGEAGTAFFLNLRALSRDPDTGFVLVGGERMPWVMNSHGDALNKFLDIPVDYLERPQHYEAWSALVSGPASGILDFSDDALEHLYEETAGHPYFTKLLCITLWKQMIARRDAHVTAVEVREAIVASLRETGVQSFAHFWTDGIFEDDPDRVQEESVRRRQILVAYALSADNRFWATEERVTHEASELGLEPPSTADELRSFVRRGVLVRGDGGTLTTKVRFVGRWLREFAVEKVVTQFEDEGRMAA
ncbi:MAG: uncharacterized protein QOG93_1030, partial [Gaiellaceae bacterium]|nr:uncharacterized protein [Gaiellaceae bacterium]